MYNVAGCTEEVCMEHLINRRPFPSPPSDEFVEATEMYREVLRSSEEHKDRLKTDSLQVCGLILLIFTCM